MQFILNKISKDPSKLGMSGKTKTYEKDILREIFNELGIDIICQKDNVLEKEYSIIDIENKQNVTQLELSKINKDNKWEFINTIFIDLPL